MAASSAKFHVLIMAGGSGTRFWPKSRAAHPKQFLNLWDEKCLLVHTVERFVPQIPADHVHVVTTEKLATKTAKLAPSVDVLGEPAAKNTAPCILWGILEILKGKPEGYDPIVAVMPADHYIGNGQAFWKALESAVAAADKNRSLVTLGVKPSSPETGYGYIELERVTEPGHAGDVKRFVEKPDQRTAAKYVQAGNFLWNAGMFIFRASVGLEAYKKCMPSLYKGFVEHAPDYRAAYAKISPSDALSVDFGVMERALEQGIAVQVVPVSCEWNDVGAYPALEEIDGAEQGEVIAHDAASNVVITDKGVVALLGVQDLVIVRDGDVVLVAAKDRAQDMKALLEKVKAKRPDLV